MNYALSKTEQQLDLRRFFDRQRMLMYTMLASMTPKQIIFAEKISTMGIPETLDVDSHEGLSNTEMSHRHTKPNSLIKELLRSN